VLISQELLIKRLGELQGFLNDAAARKALLDVNIHQVEGAVIEVQTLLRVINSAEAPPVGVVREPPKTNMVERSDGKPINE
jgi:hypothetical protein